MSTNKPLTRQDVVRLLQQARSSDKLDLSGRNLEGADLSGLDLRFANLRGANLSGANLIGAKITPQQLQEVQSLQEAIMPDASTYSGAITLKSSFSEQPREQTQEKEGKPLTRQDVVRLLQRAGSSDKLDLSGRNLEGADLSGLDLSNANLSGADLARANLSGANLSGANLRCGAGWNITILSNANLSNADLRHAYLSGGADLMFANLSNANLSGTDLSGATLSQANLSGANLRRAYLHHANLGLANLSNANLSGANLYLANLSNANLSGTDLSGADLRRAKLIQEEAGKAEVYLPNLLAALSLEGATMPDGTIYPGATTPKSSSSEQPKAESFREASRTEQTREKNIWRSIMFWRKKSQNKPLTREDTVDLLQQLTGVKTYDMRSDRERALERQAQSSLSRKDEEIAHRLLTLLEQAYVYDTDEEEEAYNRTASEIKRIGEYLCSHGGDDRMKRLAYRVSALGGSTRELEEYWDGVCGWQF